MKNDRAVGVHLADGGEHRGHVVVSAADGYGTIFKMLGTNACPFPSCMAAPISIIITGGMRKVQAFVRPG